MGEPEEKDQSEGPRSFATFVTTLAEGEAEQELSYQLHELMKRCQEEAHMRGDKVKGTLTLSVRFIVEPKGFVGIGYDVATKAPKRKTSPGVFYLTRGGNLSLENQRQQKLPLREVGGKSEMRDVPIAAATVREV